MTNFSSYNIDISDIWSFARNAVLNSSFNEKEAGILIEEVQKIIIDNCEPLFGIELHDGGDENCKRYYAQQVEKYSLAGLAEKYRLDYFVHTDKCYDYYKTKVIHSDNSNFSYWFALKLAQYDENIFVVKDFLKFHYEGNFKYDKVKYRAFLILIIRQYKAGLISERIAFTVDEWLEILDKFDYRSRDKKEIKIASQQTFKLSKNFKNTSTEKFILFLRNLKSLDLVEQTTPLLNFTSVFTGENFDPGNPIRWTGTNIELQYFVKTLQQKRKVEILKNDIWLVTSNCFVNKDGNTFTTDQLRTANGKLYKRAAIDELISKF